ncbi:MAG: hypothetical protein Q9171_000867 [Xanthocarpia ochracea]
MSKPYPPRVKLPGITPTKPVSLGPDARLCQVQTKTPTATNRDKYENKPMPPTPEASPSPVEKPLTAKKNRPYIQPATPLVVPDQMNPNSKNRAVTDPVVPKPLFTNKTSAVNQLRKKYSQTRNKSRFTKDEEEIVDRPTSPPFVVSQKASQVLGVVPTKDINSESAPASAPLSTNTSDPFRTSTESTRGRNASPSRQVQSTPVLTRRYLQENHLSAGASIRTSQEFKDATGASSNEKKQPRSTEGMIVGNESLNPTRLGTFGRTGEVGYVGQNGMHRVLSFTGVIEDPDPPEGTEDQMEPDINKSDGNGNPLRPQYSGEILHPMVYSPNKYAGVWENDPNVKLGLTVCQGHTLPPFSPFYSQQPQPPSLEVDQHSFSQTSGDVPIVLRKYPGESSHGSGYTHSLRSQNSWAPSGNGNSFAQVSAPSSAAETTPRLPAHTRNNPVPPPPLSYPGFQSSGPLPPGLVQMELNLHHHVESCFGSLMRLITDNTDRTIDKMIRRVEESQEIIEKGLKALKSEVKDLRKEVSGMRKDVADAFQVDDQMKQSIGSLDKKINGLDEKIDEIGTHFQRAVVEASESEREESSTYSRTNGSRRQRSRSTHASASSRQDYRQPYASGTTSGSASTQHSVISNSGRRSNTNTNSSGAAVRRSDERSGRKEAFAHSRTTECLVPDIRDHPAYRGVVEAPGPSNIPHKKTKQTLVWNRLSLDDSNNEEHHTSSSTKSRNLNATYHTPQIPTVKTTLPKDDLVASQAHRASSVQPTSLRRTIEIATSQSCGESQPKSLPSDAQDRSVPLLAKEPRKFHFTPTTTNSRSPSIRNPSVRHSGIQKSRKKQKQDFAVFVERTYAFEKSKSRHLNGPSISGKESHSTVAAAKFSDEPSTPRKRPLASPAERNWRAQTWKQALATNAKATPGFAGSQVEVAATDRDSDASLLLARELQQFALEETRGTNEHRDPIAKAGLNPKPPKPRLVEEQADTIDNIDTDRTDVMNIEKMPEDPDTFVFDVYVRQAAYIAEASSIGLPSTSLETADPDKVGLLVIEDEDQETWELYGEEDQSSDDGWNSEEEDENAEDYYGNDYPEDELDSDDEYDRNTYRHWQSAFDEEELDGNIGWSDDEPLARKIYKSC